MSNYQQTPEATIINLSYQFRFQKDAPTEATEQFEPAEYNEEKGYKRKPIKCSVALPGIPELPQDCADVLLMGLAEHVREYVRKTFVLGFEPIPESISWSAIQDFLSSEGTSAKLDKDELKKVLANLEEFIISRIKSESAAARVVNTAKKKFTISAIMSKQGMDVGLDKLSNTIDNLEKIIAAFADSAATTEQDVTAIEIWSEQLANTRRELNSGANEPEIDFELF